MSNPVVSDICNDLEKVLWYYVEEFDLSYPEVIGSIELVKARWADQAIIDSMSDDEDE